jgi:hypothetical protein
MPFKTHAPMKLE